MMLRGKDETTWQILDACLSLNITLYDKSIGVSLNIMVGRFYPATFTVSTGENVLIQRTCILHTREIVI